MQDAHAEPIWRDSPGRVQTMDLDPADNADQIAADGAWLGDMIRLWLDEEWSQLDIHRDIG